MSRVVTRTVARLVRVLSALGLVLGASGCRAATGLEAGEQVLTFDVAAARVPCVAVGPRECLYVRVRPDPSWQLFYDPIEGFAHEPGYEYVLLVARRTVPDPPADGSSAAYRLLGVVSKLPAASP